MAKQSFLSITNCRSRRGYERSWSQIGRDGAKRVIEMSVWNCSKPVTDVLVCHFDA